VNPKTAWQRFVDLSPAAQQQVADFITLLHSRCGRLRPHKTTKRTILAKEAFIGMWRDRDDFQDSSAWVRKLRTREWEKRRV
jgi:hypothetical protein